MSPAGGMTANLADLEAVDLDSFDPAELGSLYTKVAALEARLRARLLTRRAAALPAEPERALTLDEAAMVLGTTRTWLERRANWERVGGYRDLDRRIKFPRSALEAHLRRQKTMDKH